MSNSLFMVISSINTGLYRILICVFMSHAKYLEADIDRVNHCRVAENTEEEFLLVPDFRVLIGQC